MDIGEAAQIGRERASGLTVVKRDHLLGLPDLVLQLFNGLPGALDGLGIRHLAHGKFGGVDALQRLAMLPDLGAMPGDPAVTVRNHPTLLVRAYTARVRADSRRFRIKSTRADGVGTPLTVLSGGESKLERDPACGRRQDDGAAMAGHDRAHDRKAHAGPAAVPSGGEKGVEDPVAVLL